MFDFLPSEAHFSKIFGLSRKLKNQVSALISQRIELESMLRCLNDRLNEPKTPTKFDGARPSISIRLSRFVFLRKKTELGNRPKLIKHRLVRPP